MLKQTLQGVVSRMVEMRIIDPNTNIVCFLTNPLRLQTLLQRQRQGKEGRSDLRMGPVNAVIISEATVGSSSRTSWIGITYKVDRRADRSEGKVIIESRDKTKLHRLILLTRTTIFSAPTRYHLVPTSQRMKRRDQGGRSTGEDSACRRQIGRHHRRSSARYRTV
jgi:hypothetical protein